MTEFNDTGLMVSPDELERATHIIVWGQMWIPRDSGGVEIGPWTPIMWIPIDKEQKERLAIKKPALIGTYISCEVRP